MKLITLPSNNILPSITAEILSQIFTIQKISTAKQVQSPKFE